jgi:hypothetical protein
LNVSLFLTVIFLNILKKKKMVCESWEKKMSERKAKSGVVLTDSYEKERKKKKRKITIFIGF